MTMSAAPIPWPLPAQRMIDFCNGVISRDLPDILQAGLVSAPLHELLPPYITIRLQKAFPKSPGAASGYF